MRQKLCISIVMLFVLGVQDVFAGDGQKLYSFDIPASTVNSALKAVAEQAGSSAIFPYDQVKNIQAEHLQGRYTLDDALIQILVNTGLKANITAEGVIVVINPDSVSIVREEEMRKESKKGLFAGGMAAFVGAVFGASVNAQDSVPSSGGFSLEEITVTARRVEESLQGTPLAVTAVTGDMMAVRGVEQITAVSDIAPNVNFSFGGTTSGSDSAAVIFIRGIGQNDFTLVTDPGVGLYVDGVYYSRTIGSVLDVFDLERIEVLRGPQGTLFGRNSTGGAISLTSRNPGEEYSGSVKASLGDEGRRELSASFDVPVNDEFGMIFSALKRQRDGSAVDASGREYGDDDMFGARVKGFWTPSEDFSLMISADYVSEDEGSAAEVPLVRSADGSVSGSTAIDFTPVTADQGLSLNDQEAFGISATAEWAINDELLIKSITAYRELDAFFARTPSSATNFSTVDDYQHEQFSQELQFIGTSGSVDYVTGIFYLTEEGNNVGLVDVGVAPGGWPRAIGVDQVENENYAVFGEATWNISDTLRLITGARYTDETKKASFVSENIPGVTRGTVATDPVLDFLAFSGLQPLEFSETTYRLVLQNDFQDSLTGYLSASTGFKSGGFQPRIVGGFAGQVTAPDTFLPEFVDSYELGLKTTLDNFRLNAAVFVSEYSDLQVSGAPVGEIATQTFNGGEASINGIEIEATWTPTPLILVDLSLGWLDAEYDRIDGSNTEISVADELVRAPKHSVSLGASYLLQLGDGSDIKVRVDVTNKGETHFEPNNSISSFEDGYTNVNFNVAYTSPEETLILRAGVNNFTDETYLVAADANASLGYDLGVFARPRNYYLSAEYNF